MNLEAAKFLLTELGRQTLNELMQSKITASDEIKTVSRLRKSFDMVCSSALMEAAIARQKAMEQNKFSKADKMFFTKTGLEQSSGEAISNYRILRFSEQCKSGERIADLCCGIGGDTIALSQSFDVVGYDLDESRLLFAEANAAAYGNKERFQAQVLNVGEFDPQGFSAAFFDPARRDSNGKRIFDPEKYGPPLSKIYPALKKLKGIAVKASPGIDYEALRESAPNFEVEIISENGDVKEAVLWFGAFKSKANRRATLLVQGAPLSLDDSAGLERLPLGPLGRFIHEPDGAIIRAGLVELLGEPLNATKIDEQIAYLSGDEPSLNALAHSFEIIAQMPFSMKKLKKRLTELNCSRVVVKKRGSPLTPEEVQNGLGLRGDGVELTVILTRVKEEHTAIICLPAKKSVQEETSR